MNIFPVKVLFKKRNVLKWIEHVLALQADKYGVKALKKNSKTSMEKNFTFKKSKSDVSRCLYTCLCTF